MELRTTQRIYLSIFFFISGVCFSTWASRIPTIKSQFGYSDAQLGTILVFLPIASLAGVPVSKWLVSRFDSRIPLTAGYIMMALSLVFVGIAPNTVLLIVSISLFAFSLRMLNISANTQAIILQKQYSKPITGSFHGLWSTGGIVGVGISTALVALDVPMNIHLGVVAGLTLVATLICYRHLLRGDRTPAGNKIVMGKPDPYIVYLGLMVFFAAICEGGMFDWSGLYFKDVVGEKIFTTGYLLFMVFMATSRFASDKFVQHFGMERHYITSSVLVMGGIALAVIFPGFWPSLIGFCLVGFGTAAIIPMTYLLAGQSTKYSPGVTISIIATYSIVGMFLGPPLVGYLSELFGLRYAFITFGVAGATLIPISQMLFRKDRVALVTE